jgi:hypothetical protein
MYCYAVCGIHVDGDDLNEKVLKPNFGGQSFCVPNVKGTSNHESFIMQNSATGEPLKFYDDKLSKIIQGLIQISDTNGCDYWYHDIIAEIWKHDDRDGSVTRVNSHTIDD